MIEASIILLLTAFCLHLFYENMPCKLFDKIGNPTRYLSHLLPCLSVLLLICSAIPREAQAVDPKTDYEYIDSKIAVIESELNLVKSEISKGDKDLNDKIEALTDNYDSQLKDIREALEKANDKLSSQKTEPESEPEHVPEPEPEQEPETEPEPVIEESNTSAEVYIPISLYLRKQADGNSDILLTIPAGQSAVYLDEVSGWYHVSYNGVTGYVSRRLTEKR